MCLFSPELKWLCAFPDPYYDVDIAWMTGGAPHGILPPSFISQISDVALKIYDFVKFDGLFSNPR